MSLPQQRLPSHWSDAQRGHVKLCESMSSSMTHFHWPLPKYSKAGTRCLPSAAGTTAEVEGCADSRRTQKDRLARPVSSVTFLKGRTARLNDTHWPLTPRIFEMFPTENHSVFVSRRCFPQLAGTALSTAESEALPQEVRAQFHKPRPFQTYQGAHVFRHWPVSLCFEGHGPGGLTIDRPAREGDTVTMVGVRRQLFDTATISGQRTTHAAPMLKKRGCSWEVSPQSGWVGVADRRREMSHPLDDMGWGGSIRSVHRLTIDVDATIQSFPTHGTTVFFPSACLAPLASTMEAMLSLLLWGGIVDMEDVEVGASLAGALSMILSVQARRRLS